MKKDYTSKDLFDGDLNLTAYGKEHRAKTKIDMLRGERVSGCCGALTTEPDSSGSARCMDCKEGCMVEYLEEDEEQGDEYNREDEDLPEDEAEREVEDYLN